MSNILGVDLKLDQEYLAKCVKELVQTSMVDALDSKNNIVEGAIKHILNTKVDSKGQVNSSSYYNDTPLIEYTVKTAIVELTKEVINEEIIQKKDIISEMIKREINKKSNMTKFVDSFINNTAKTLENSYRTNININFEERQD